MSSHFLSICTGLYGVRPVRYRFDHLSKILKGRFWKVGAVQRRVQMEPNFAEMWMRVRRTHTDTFDRI